MIARAVLMLLALAVALVIGRAQRELTDASAELFAPVLAQMEE